MLLPTTVIGPQVDHSLRSHPYMSSSGAFVGADVASSAYSYSGVLFANALVIGLSSSSRSGISGRQGRGFGRASFSKDSP